ncbi:MAG: amino acid adenylation domain-containing protein [Pseudomonadota bacterium]
MTSLVFPASSAQQRFWVLQSLNPESSAYNVTEAIWLKGSVDVAALKRAFSHLVARHGQLRTVFSLVDGEVVQHERSAQEVAGAVSLHSLPRSEFDAWLREEVSTPFDLTTGPLFRAHLLELGGEEWFFVLSVHHIITDGWSSKLFFTQLAQAYDRFLDGVAPTWTKDAGCFQEAVEAESRYLASPQFQTDLEAAAEAGAAGGTSLDLPVSGTPQPVPDSGTLRVGVSSALETRLDELARSLGLTRFMLYLAGYGVLLSRYTGQDSVSIGIPISTRDHLTGDETYGVFINTVSVDIDLRPADTWKTFLMRVRDASLTAFSTAAVPFDRLVSRVDGPPLQAMLVVQPEECPVPSFKGLETAWWFVENRHSKFDLLLQIDTARALLPGEDAPRGRSFAALEYRADTISSRLASQMLENWGALLEALVSAPDAVVSDVDFASGKEKALHERLLRASEGDEILDPVRAFADIAHRRPDLPAIRHDGGVVTYGDLERRVSEIRQALVGEGIASGDFVGVCLRRTPDLVAALLAILGCGGAYVPLDPNYPPDRLKYIARDSRCALILMEHSTRSALPEDRTPLLDIGTVSAIGDTARARMVHAPAEQTAYLIYTSGSTGRPKGVMIPRRALNAFLGWAGSAFSPAELGCVLASTSVCFDLSVFEIFLPLSVGGSIRLVENALELIEKADPPPTLVNTVPSAMAELVQANALTPDMKAVNLAGEPLTRKLTDAIQDRLPSVRLCNLYGPSEDTTYSTWSEVPSGTREEPTIGRPVLGTNGYVLNDRLQPVPAGVAGELYLGGQGVALGYLNRPDLTAERFLPDPRLPGQRMYGTGDRVMLLATGELKYLGRNDHQIKLRGFRIETVEIESVARKLEDIEQVLVTLCEVGQTPHLAIYWTGAASAETIKAALKSQLPGYMVPSFFVSLESFPLNANGKIDRAALPAPDRVVSDDVVRLGPTETQVAEIMQGLTSAPELSADTDFFDIGGHSLLVMRLIAMLHERLGVRLTLADIFELRSVRRIAEKIDRAAPTPEALPPLMPMAGDGPAPLSFAQERMWMLEQLRSGSVMLNIGVGTAIEGELDVRALRAAIQSLTRRHSALRLRIGRDAEGRLQQIAKPKQSERVYVRELTAKTHDERDALLREVLSTPFDLTTEAPARWILVREPEQTVLALIIHHLAADAWSLDVIFGELWTTYAALLTERQSDEAAVPSVLDYGLWQRQYIDKPASIERDLTYWREALADLPDRLQLPFDHPPATAVSYRGARLRRRLSDNLMTLLQKVANEADASTFTGLLAVYQALLSRLSMQDDIVVGTPIANREIQGTQSLIGCLLNTLALRADLTDRPSFRSLLGQMRQRSLEAFGHQTAPFELVVAELGARRAVEHTPVMQAMLVFNGDAPRVLTPQGLNFTPVDIPPVATQYDMTLMIGRDAEGWYADWDYRRDLFEPETLGRFADWFERLLAAAVHNPERPLHALPLAETAKSVGTIAPKPATLPELFAAQVARTPEAIAVEDDTGRLTYRELDRQADALAARLAALGIGVEDRVAVVLPKSCRSVTAVMAIAKAGAAFLVLDPSLPQERLELIVRDAGIRAQITDEDREGHLSGRLRHTLRVDAGDEHGVASRPSAVPAPDNLAYVIYTSGSTGKPKGVLVTHRGLAQLQQLHRDDFRSGPGSHVLQYAPPTFDAAVWDLVMALLNGACLHVTAPEAVLPGAPLAATLRERGITHLTLPPSNMAMLAPDCGHVLQNLTFAGEALPSDVLRRWSGVERVWNGYGPSETTVCATIGNCRKRPADQALGIGTALAGTQIYVLDEGLNPAPHGLAGELFVGGDGVARGYLGQPGKTAERFLPDPFTSKPGARMYRTGDLVRRDARGDLQFLGRVDDQVKLRGIRIEIGEIEHVLHDLDAAITDAAVVIAGEGEERHLVGFVAGPVELDVYALHGALADKLPAYMVPAWLQRVDRFPLTRNGKLDRKALIAIAAPQNTAHVQKALPRGPVEQEIAEIWQGLLPGVTVGRNDPFFSLGGTSLLMIRMHEELERRYRGALKPIDLFRLNTVTAIAEALETQGAVEPEDTIDFTFRL